jgi:hypothetical protein
VAYTLGFGGKQLVVFGLGVGDGVGVGEGFGVGFGVGFFVGFVTGLELVDELELFEDLLALNSSDSAFGSVALLSFVLVELLALVTSAIDRFLLL